MTRPAIIINELDAERIDRLLEQPAFANLPVADALNDELDRAQMLAPEAMPHDVVTMNSKVKFRDLTSGEERVRTLVFPSQVTDSASQLSVLAPVGAALLGLKVGSTIHWELPGGASTHLEVLALLAGALTGSALRIEDRMNDLGEWVHRKLGGAEDSHFVDGFVTASLLFCVGPLAILGSLNDGLGRGADQLLIKSVLDGFASIAFASTLGLGVMVAAVPLAIYQGSLTVAGHFLGNIMPAAQIDALTVAGGIILMGLGIRLIGLKDIRVADLLPALVFAPVFVWIAGLL